MFVANEIWLLPKCRRIVFECAVSMGVYLSITTIFKRVNTRFQLIRTHHVYSCEFDAVTRLSCWFRDTFDARYSCFICDPFGRGTIPNLIRSFLYAWIWHRLFGTIHIRHSFRHDILMNYLRHAANKPMDIVPSATNQHCRCAGEGNKEWISYWPLTHRIIKTNVGNVRNLLQFSSSHRAVTHSFSIRHSKLSFRHPCHQQSFRWSGQLPPPVRI